MCLKITLNNDIFYLENIINTSTLAKFKFFTDDTMINFVHKDLAILFNIITDTDLLRIIIASYLNK